MKKVGWQNGTLVSKAKVTVDSTIYEVEPEEYEGTTPISAENLKAMEDNAESAINGTRETDIPTSDVTAGTNYTLPSTYTVGANDLLVYWEGELLTPDVHYSEVGSTGATSSTIQFLDWDVPADSMLEFIFKN